VKRVLFLSYYFPPMGGSGVQRAHQFARYLPSEGLLPIIIAGPVDIKDHWAPMDSSLSASIPPEVSVHYADGSLKPPDSKLRSRMSRFLATTPAFSRWWVRAAVELGLERGSAADIIFATMSPFESALAGATLSRLLGVPWVADLRDPWALDETRIYPTLLHRRIEMARMDRALRSAALIIMNTPQAARDLKDAFPTLRENKIIAITNGFDSEDFAEDVLPRSDGKFRILHSGLTLTHLGRQLQRGSIYRVLGGVEPGVDIITRSPEFLLRAIKHWMSTNADAANHVEVWFVGKISEEDHSILESSGISQLIHVTGHLPHMESIRLIRTADLLFLPMHNLPPGRRCRSIPGKAYEYMASGRPILAAVPEGEARDFLTQCGTASICAPNDVTGMARILQEAYTAWKNRAGNVKPNVELLRTFTRQHLAFVLAEALRVVVNEAKLRGQIGGCTSRAKDRVRYSGGG
jgi:glycosyltransferase involved in cell wall biosynthesis